MSLVDSWGKMWFRPHRAWQPKPCRKRSSQRLELEWLEGRHLLSYAITDLGLLPGFVWTYGTAINASGQVAGTAHTPPGYNSAVLFSDGTVTDLGLPAPSFGFGINDSGQVVGSAHGHAFLYSDGETIDLGTLGGRFNIARGINNAGTVVGSGETAGGGGAGWLYRDGQMTPLDVGPTSINNRDQVAGSADASGSTHAVFWDNGQITDLGTLPDDDTSIGTALNDAGQVVGVSWLNESVGFSVHAFLYSDGVMTNLGTLGGRDTRATGINNAGQIVGLSDLKNTHHAFLYSDGTMTDLNELIDPGSGWILYDANGINDAGQIVGEGASPDGELHAFVLTPDSKPLKQDPALFLHDPGVVRVQVSWFGLSKSEYSTVASTPGESLVANPHTGEIQEERPLPGSAKFWLGASGPRALAARSTNAESASDWFDPRANSQLS